jgi:hypothetical protein
MTLRTRALTSAHEGVRSHGGAGSTSRRQLNEPRPDGPQGRSISGQAPPMTLAADHAHHVDAADARFALLLNGSRRVFLGTCGLRLG